MPDISEELVCPVCLGADFEEMFTKGGRDYWRCCDCGLERIWPLPGDADLEAYYERSYEAGLYKPFVETPGMLARRSKSRIQQVAPHVKNGRWLDVGCSTGEFVAAAIAFGQDASGIELSGEAVDQARELGRPVSRSAVESFRPAHRFDTVTAFDVIEHVRDPRLFLDRVRELCTRDGILILTTPDVNSWSRRLMGRRWFFYIPEEHLFHFTPDNLSRLLDATGYDVVAVKKARKHVSFDYGLTQFEEFNPLVYKILSTVRSVLPRRLREWQFPVHLGEMMVVARRRRQ
jgi:SAM-dependent methyltransferase